MPFGSDVIIDILKQHDIDYIACNPGASFRGLHDSIVNYANNDPELIMCCHEEISVAIAHGYAKASGKYMAVFIHANIGLQHASMAIFNAWCDRVPILLIGGIGPMDAVKRRPWIEWIHTSHHHDAIIRDYVKWCDQPYTLAAVPDSLYRACRIIDTEPKAPAYIAIDCEIQEDSSHNPITFTPKKLPKLSPPHPDPTILTQVAQDLMQAKFPLIMADHFGRKQNVVDDLINLAELLAAAVIDRGGRYNFPTNHPLCLTEMTEELFTQVDYVLCLDVQDVWGGLGKFIDGTYYSYIQPAVPIVHVTLADYLVSKWAADYQKLYPVTHTIAADSAVTVAALLNLCRNQISRDVNRKRYHYLQQQQQAMRQHWRTLALSQRSNEPLLTETVIFEIGEAIKNEDWLLVNGGSLAMDQWAKRLWDFCRPGCYIGGSGGAGLGYGLGASIGAALAYKGSNKLCLNLQADGDFLFTPSALWTAAYYQVPLLIIIMNNRSYNNSKEHAVKIAKQRARPIERANIGTDFAGTPIDFPQMARSYNIHAFATITACSEIQPTIRKAIHYIKTEQKPVLVDVVIQ